MGFSRQEYWSGVLLPSLKKSDEAQLNPYSQGEVTAKLSDQSCAGGSPESCSATENLRSCLEEVTSKPRAEKSDRNERAGL